MIRFPNDEPAYVDKLGRESYVQALSTVLESCETPYTVGLYGTWGAGKTSLMRQLQSELDAKPGNSTVWFDPWQHQFDEHPAIALVQTAYETLSRPITASKRDRMRRVVLSFSLALAKEVVAQVPVVGSSLANLVEHGEQLANSVRAREQEELFKRRDLQRQLNEAFGEFVRLALDEDEAAESDRIFFFIDDLDRCTPDRVVSLLESIKLFMSTKKAVFVLGLDRKPIEAAIRHQYEWSDQNEAEYLDKIVQLQFALPPVAQESSELFVRESLSGIFREEPLGFSPVVQDVIQILCVGIGGNPRALKRVVGTFSLMHLLARDMFYPYDPSMLALILLVQLRAPKLFEELTRQPDKFVEIFPDSGKSSAENQSLYQQYVTKDHHLSRAISIASNLKNEVPIKYLQLASPPAELEREHFIPDILRMHRIWLDSNHTNGEKAVLEGLNLTKFSFEGMDLSWANLKASILHDSTFSDSFLTNSAFDKAEIIESNMEFASIDSATFIGAQMRNVSFANSIISKSDFSGSSCVKSTFANAQITRSKFDSSIIEECDFTDCFLEGADMTKIGSLRDCVMFGSELVDCSFYKEVPDLNGVKRLEKCSFIDCIFDEIDFRITEILDCLFVRCNFRKTVFTGNSLAGASFESCSFAGAVLNSCNLSDMVLPDTSFEGSQLNKCNLRNSILTGANFVGSRLIGADLSNADVRGAIFLDATTDGALLEFISDEDTVFDYESHKRLLSTGESEDSVEDDNIEKPM